MKFPTLGNQKGSAIGLVMTTLLSIGLIMYQLTYTSSVTSAITSNYRNQSVAFRLAESGLTLQLLRLNIFQKAKLLRAGTPGADQTVPDSMLDQIWKTPFSYPPPSALELSMGQKDAIDKFVKTSSLKGKFQVSGESLSAKLNLNDLVFEPTEKDKAKAGTDPEYAKALKDFQEGLSQRIADQIIQAIKNKMENDEKFRTKHSSLLPERIVNAIKDFIDRDTTGIDGGAEPDDPPYPNRPLLSMSELRTIRGIDDDIYDIIDPLFKVFHTRGVNVNAATVDVFKSLFPQATPEEIAELIKARDDPKTGEDWPTVEAFYKSVEASVRSIQTSELKKQLEGLGIELMTTDNSFIIRSRGEYNNASRNITAVVLDASPPPPPQKTAETGQQTPPPAAPTNSAAQSQILKLAPPVVFVRID